jgi:predicted lipoprotein with Yx(FWY)xxD motif
MHVDSIQHLMDLMRATSQEQRVNHSSLMRNCSIAALAIALGLGTGVASAYSVPYSTPPGVTTVDVSETMELAAPTILWRRLGDEHGKPLYTHDADQQGRSSCYGECAEEFPPFVADSHARASGDFSIIRRDDHVLQWAYQGKALYRYSGKDLDGEPIGVRFQIENPAWHDPSSSFYSPKAGWRRAAYAPEKSTGMPPTVQIDGLAVADGFGLVDAIDHKTIYATPPSHKLPIDWHPLRASAMSIPIGQFTIIRRKEDGTRQWAYRGEALYTYTGDYAAGEVNGIFSGDKSVQAALVYRDFLPRSVEIGSYLGRGPLLTGPEGLTLYYVARFYAVYAGRETRTGYFVTYNDAKSQGAEGCQTGCTKSWKPLIAPSDARAQGFWEAVRRPDGLKQWAFKGSPLYTFTGDQKPGEIAGNNRSVIVYGGPNGIAYADPGGDPRYPQPQLGQIDLELAVGPPVPERSLPGAPVKPKAAASGVAKVGSQGAALGGNDPRAGAGFYWHTAGLFY